jgi:DNA-binding MarR family transcriptional regulator
MNDKALLAAIYRGRPATLSELSTLSHLEADEARRTLHSLRQRGLLGGAGDKLLYPNPAAARTAVSPGPMWPGDRRGIFLELSAAGAETTARINNRFRAAADAVLQTSRVARAASLSPICWYSV